MDAKSFYDEFISRVKEDYIATAEMIQGILLHSMSISE